MSFVRRPQREKQALLLSSQEAGQRRKRSVLDRKCSMDQRGNNSLMSAAACSGTLKFSENSENLRNFGGHGFDESPRFLMRDQVDRRHE
jgi:hypothetical protein